MPRFSAKYAPEALEEIQNAINITTKFLMNSVADLSKIYSLLLKLPN